MKDIKSKVSKNRRSKFEVDAAINQAATEEILKKGFTDTLVSDIIKRAKIEPVVFYTRYKNLSEFYDELVKEYDYWFHDVLKQERSEVEEKEYKGIMTGLLATLLQSPMMLELLRWEVNSDNETTKRTAQLREFHTLPLADKYDKLFKESNLDIVAISSLMIGGIYYMCLHKDRSPFCGIDLNTSEGVDRIKKALISLSSLMFQQNKIKDLQSE